MTAAVSNQKTVDQSGGIVSGNDAVTSISTGRTAEDAGIAAFATKSGVVIGRPRTILRLMHPAPAGLKASVAARGMAISSVDPSGKLSIEARAAIASVPPKMDAAPLGVGNPGDSLESFRTAVILRPRDTKVFDQT